MLRLERGLLPFPEFAKCELFYCPVTSKPASTFTLGSDQVDGLSRAIKSISDKNSLMFAAALGKLAATFNCSEIESEAINI
jgi:hypothetical protein